MEQTYAQLLREGWLSLKEAQEALGYSSHSTLVKYLLERKIEGIKVDGRWAISPEGLEQAREIAPRRRGSR